MLHRLISLALMALVLVVGGPVFDALAQSDNDVLPPGETFVFSRFEFVGDVLLPMDPLHEAFQPLVGMDLSMEGLLELGGVVEAYYAQHGFPFVLVYFPEQTVEEGIVYMAVVVGRYGRIGLDNRSRLKSWVAERLLRDFAPFDPIYVPDLDAKIMRLQSFPGITSEVFYSAGDQFGQTDVTFEIDDTKQWQGGITVATAGPRLFQDVRLATDVTLFNPFGRADRVDVALSTDGSSTAHLEGTYQLPVGIALDYDFRANVSWSGYRMAGSWAGLGSGWDGQIGLGLTRTWTMPTGAQVRGDVSAVHHRAEDEFIGSVSSHQVTTVTGSAMWTPPEGQPDISYHPEQWTVDVILGQLGLGTPDQRSLDAATAKTQGFYALVRADAQWRFPLRIGSATTRLSGQWAAKNLASAEKFSLTQKVRSGLVGRGAGDDGWSVQIEYSPGPVPVPPLPGGWLATAFIDAAGVSYNKTPWDATGRGGRWAMGAGLRLDWQPMDGMTARLQQGWTLFDAEGIVAPGDAGPLSLSITYSF